MSKIIRMTEQHMEELRKEFDVALRGMKLSDGKLTYSKTFGNVGRKAELIFSEAAYLKMTTLVRECDKEIAWHGIAKRGDDPTKDEYIVSDILVYPQEVTGSTVTTDQEKYQMWLQCHEDEIFNNIRMQGHSHVNMSTTPSAVDTTWYEQILGQLEDDMFYIFLIWNKRGEKTIKIYDMAKNVLFETADITVRVADGAYGLEKFVEEAKKMVQEKKPAPVTTYGKGSNTVYGGYNPYTYGGQQRQTPAATPAVSKTPVTSTVPVKSKESEEVYYKKKKKKPESSQKQTAYGGYSGYNGRYYDDDDDEKMYREMYGMYY